MLYGKASNVFTVIVYSQNVFRVQSNDKMTVQHLMHKACSSHNISVSIFLAHFVIVIYS